ncbi:hypothetical protein HYT18_02615 [Candidatus Microgenomates bacterium]|nr:hypothetical protein [Candidatus Microgenomates bacterium]
MPAEFEQGKFDRFHIKLTQPGNEEVHIFTYLLTESSCLGYHIIRDGNGKLPEDLLRSIVEETPPHRQAISNLRNSLRLLGKKRLINELPEDNQPLVIYQSVKRAVDKSK